MWALFASGSHAHPAMGKDEIDGAVRVDGNAAWWCFCAGSFACLLAGFNYTFGEWSPILKKSLQLSQEQLETLALAKDLGGLLNLDAGYVTNRFGPHVSVAVGTSSLTVSSLLVFQAVSQWSMSFPAMILLCAIFGHSMAYCDNAAISTSVANFPKHKGSAVGLMKAMEGLTVAIANTIFYSFYSEQDVVLFPVCIAATSLCVGLVSVPLIAATNRQVEEDDRRVTGKFSFLTVGLLLCTAFCGVAIYTKAYSWPTALVALIALLMGLLALTVASPCDDREGSSRLVEHRESGRPNISTWTMLQKPDFYLMFFALVSMEGTGLMVSNNFSQIVKALHGASAVRGLTAFSICSTLARIFAGFGSEYLKEGLNRPWFLALAATVMTLACLLLQLGPSVLTLCAGLVGFGMGTCFALQAVLLEELFGPKEMPIKYSCSFCAACLGSLILSNVAGSLYDLESALQHSSQCLGPTCFAGTFLVASFFNFCALVCASALAVRTRDTYAQLNQTSCLAIFVEPI